VLRLIHQDEIGTKPHLDHAGVQFAQNKDGLYAAEHSEYWLVYADGAVTVVDADPREAGRTVHPNADSIDD
jgi:hypothetical protein